MDSYTYTPDNTQKTQLNNEIRSAKRSIVMDNNRITELKENIAKEEAYVFELEHAEELVKTMPVQPSIHYILSDRLLAEKTLCNDRKLSDTIKIEQFTQGIAMHQETIAKAKFKLSTLKDPEPVTFNTGIVNEAFENNPHASNFDIIRDEYDDDEVLLTWEFSGLYATVDENPYPNINDGGEVKIPVYDCEVRVRISDGQVWIDPIHGEGENYYESSEETVHPHVLSGHEPCLGDFGETVRNSLHDGDALTLISAIQMFLEQIHNDDSAGRTWVNYIEHRLYEEESESSLFGKTQWIEDIDRPITVRDSWSIYNGKVSDEGELGYNSDSCTWEPLDDVIAHYEEVREREQEEDEEEVA